MTAFIPQMEPVISEGDARAVHAYMTSGGWLTEFQHTRLFEKCISDYTGAHFCVIAPSGTLALFLALAACGVGHGDEVIVPDLTMAATATAAILAGAEVLFADIDRATLCLDLETVEQRITPRTKAVVFVSLNGRAPVGLEAFVERCRDRGIRVIEDAAQSLGSFAGQRHLGTIGDCGCFSFSSQKIVTTGQGGAVVTNDERLFNQMSLLRDFGRLHGGTDHYLTVGWNLKFTDLQAVVGVEQMRRLPALVERKRALFRLYRERLSGLDAVEMPATDLDQVTPWFIDVLVDPAAKQPLIDHLRQSGIGSRPFYPALHAEPAFATSGSFPLAEEMSARGLWLPSSLRLEPEHVTATCDAIRRFFGA